MVSSLASRRSDTARYSVLRIVALVLVLTTVGGVAGCWQVLDGPCYDLFLRWRARWSTCADHVLLVHAEEQHWTLPRLSAVVDKLRGMGAASVSLVPPNGGAYVRLCDELQAAVDFVPSFNLGVPTTRAMDRPSQVELAAAWSARVPRNQQAVLYLPRADGGVLRQQALGVALSDERVPTLEGMVAQAWQGNIDEFGVDFRGGAGSLPHLSAAQVEEGRIIADLVQGRHVLLGTSPDPHYLGLTTPLTKGDYRISPLEFHGHALNTLLNRTPLREVPFGGQLIVVALSTALAAWLSQQVSQRGSHMVLVSMLLLLLVSSLLLLVTCGLWLPLAPSVMGLAVAYWCVIDRRLTMVHQVVRKMDFELVNRARRRRQPTNLILASEPWSILGQWAQQILPLKQLAFFESRAYDMYLRSVYTHGCAPHELIERRRDSRRHPFSTATEHGGAYRLPPDRPLFPVVVGQPQYLVPLTFRGQSVGFMAVSVAAPHHDESRQRILNLVAQEIARIFVQWQFHAAARQPRWSDWFGTRSEEQALVGLMHSTHLLEDRLLRLENIVDTTTSGMAVFDGFGRVLALNQKLASVLQNEGLSPDPRQLDLLVSQLAGQPIHFVRDQLRTLLNEGVPQTLYVELRHSRTSWILSLRAVVGLETTSEWHEEVDQVSLPSSDALPFRCHAVVLELVSRDTVDVLQLLTDSLEGELLHAN